MKAIQRLSLCSTCQSGESGDVEPHHGHFRARIEHNVGSFRVAHDLQRQRSVRIDRSELKAELKSELN